MRKDVKLGFAIGGILFSVLIVYVLVMSGGNTEAKPEQVRLVTNESSTAAKTDSKASTPAPAPAQNERRRNGGQRQNNASEVAKTDANAIAPKTENKSEKRPTDPFANAGSGSSTKPADGAVATATPGSDRDQNSSRTDAWAVLNGAAPLPLLTNTPTSRPSQVSAETTSPEGHSTNGVQPTPGTPIMASSSGNPANTPADLPVRSSNSSNNANGPTTRRANLMAESAALRNAVVPPTPAVSTPGITTPTTPAASGTNSTAGKTHVVAAGETFSSIAAEAYGNSAYYPHLIRANPNIDPKKLKAGMTIVLPPENEVKAVAGSTATAAGAGSTAAPAVAASAKIDEKTEYRVESGDTLSRISAKLYGSSNRWDKIYENNKTLIGADPQKLKVGMVLKLPDAPTVR